MVNWLAVCLVIVILWVSWVLAGLHIDRINKRIDAEYKNRVKRK